MTHASRGSFPPEEATGGKPAQWRGGPDPEQNVSIRSSRGLMQTRRFLLPLLSLPLLSSVATAKAPCDPRGGALIVRPRRPAEPLSAQLGALAPLVHDAALGLALQQAWRCFTPDEVGRMRSTLVWARDALSRPGFGEVSPAMLKTARRRGRDAAARLIEIGADSEAARAMQVSLRYVFAREGRGRAHALPVCDADWKTGGASL